MTTENNAFKLLIISFLFITAMSFGRMVFAQEVTDTEIAPGGGVIVEDTEPVAATDEGFNALWLLPLLAVPVLLYLIWPRNKVNRMDLSQGYAGIKGGRSEDGSLFETELERERKI